MDNTTLVIAAIVAAVVGFFAYQWYLAAQKGKAAKKAPVLREKMVSIVEPIADPNAGHPEVPGQSNAELRAKEPLQRSDPPTQQRPVGPEARSPPAFDDSLRRPEQSFHAPQAPQGVPSDVAAGRAGAGTSGNPATTHVQNFSPEMAQNGGPVVGSSVFAFDGSEPTGYASF